MFQINSFWFGGALSDIEQICFLSMLRQGHKVRVFHYEPLQNVPSGVEVADARELMARDEFIIHRKTGSPALGADRLRYRILRHGLGLWLDADMILLRPVFQEDYVFGWEDETYINGAVLYLPMKAKVTDALARFSEKKRPIPPFYDLRGRLYLLRKAIVGAPIDAQDLPWGVYGPKALTYFVHKYNFVSHAKPRHVFYPVHWSEAHALVSQGFNHRELINESTVAVHLWNAQLRRPSKLRPQNPVGSLIVEKGSFVETFARVELGYRLDEVR